MRVDLTKDEILKTLSILHSEMNRRDRRFLRGQEASPARRAHASHALVLCECVRAKLEQALRSAPPCAE